MARITNLTAKPIFIDGVRVLRSRYIDLDDARITEDIRERETAGDISIVMDAGPAVSPADRELTSKSSSAVAVFTPSAAAYVSGKVVDTFKEFAEMGNPGDTIRISDLDFMIDIAALQSGEGAYRLYLYSAPPPSALTDNVAFALGADDRPYFRGFIDIAAPANYGGTLYLQNGATSRSIKLDRSSLYGYLVAMADFNATAVARRVTIHNTGR